LSAPGPGTATQCFQCHKTKATSTFSIEELALAYSQRAYLTDMGLKRKGIDKTDYWGLYSLISYDRESTLEKIKMGFSLKETKIRNENEVNFDLDYKK